MSQTPLKSMQFRREREASWVELEELLDRIEKHGIRSLSSDALMRLPLLYRAATSSLSVARAVSLDRNVENYLESLVGRAYIAVYARPRSPMDAVLQFLTVGFPRTVRRYLPHLAVSTLLLFGGALAGYWMVLADSERFYSLVPEAYADGRNPHASTEELRAVLYDAPEEGVSGLQYFAAFLFTHNARIGLMAFALGFLAGAPTVYLLFTNGLTLGAFAGLYASRGLSAEFWAWVLPHGVTELGAICLCGMGGLALGMAVVFPGERSRLDRLAARGREVGAAAVGCVLLFFVAALIEGFFRQLVSDVTVRWAVVGLTSVGWLVYFGWLGRGRDR